VEPEGVATTLAQGLTAARMFRWGVLQRLKDGVKDLNRRLQENRIGKNPHDGTRLLRR
jgi:hypothetical protein